MFFGRERQIQDLMSLWRKRVASLVSCRGRRRIGKSALIEKFAEKSNCRFIKLEGIKPQPGFTDANELQSFGEQLAAQTGCDSTTPSNWLNAFIRLNDKISDRERTVVLLDEISWMGHYDDDFAETLKVAWDNYWKKHDRLVVVVCGSVSSWIRENIVENGAFVGRRSLDLVVDELPLKECVRFWGKAAGRMDTREIVDVLSVTGGVPKYLEEIDPSLSAADNIARLCFRPHGLLRDDFAEMFCDTVTHLPALSGRVVRTLVGGSRTLSEISDILKMTRSGSVSSVLKCLEEAGFVRRDGGRNPETGAPIRDVRYRLRDNYARFYLKYVEPVSDAIDDGSYAFVALEELPEWETIMGLAFENLVVNHYRELLPFLHLDGALVEGAAPYVRSATKSHPGCQVDLLLKCRRSLHFVEIKRRRQIGREVIDQVDEQVRRVDRPPGVSARTALVYEGELSPVARTDGYFDSIVRFGDLLGL